VSRELVFAFSLFGIILGISSVIYSLVTLFAGSKVVVGMAIGEAILNIFFSFLLSRFVGLEGIAYGTVVATLISVVLPGLFIVVRHFKGEVRINLLPLVYQIVLFVFFAGLIHLIGFLDFLDKSIVFVTYFFLLFVAAYLFDREFFRAIIKNWNS
jgi:hypothetical protein